MTFSFLKATFSVLSKLFNPLILSHEKVATDQCEQNISIQALTDASKGRQPRKVMFNRPAYPPGS